MHSFADYAMISIAPDKLANVRGALAQLVARNVRIVEVRGSNPLCSTIGEPDEPPAMLYFIGKAFVLVAPLPKRRGEEAPG